jgi:hypothetical protein
LDEEERIKLIKKEGGIWKLQLYMI